MCKNCNETFREDECYLEFSQLHINNDKYFAHEDEYGDIFIEKSQYYTYAQFCSPCAPGACYLSSPLSQKIENNKCYCFGHEMFETNAPYPVYDLKTNKLIKGE